MTMMRMIYTSRRASGVTDAQVIDMVGRAVAKNRVLNVTGCLWFGNERFLQVIEGERKAIHDLYELIKPNPMHHDIQIVYYAMAEKRLFDRWSMGFVKEDEDEFVADLIAGFFARHQSTLAAETPSQLRRVLSHLREALDVEQSA